MAQYENIKCPYCFNTFAHDEVHFRLARQTVDKAEKEFKNATDEEKKLISPYKKLAGVDSYYSVIWGENKGGELQGSDHDLFFYPYITPSNKDKMAVGGDYIRDKDGFVEKVQDKYGNYESKTRICPHCHNRLPERYGKNEQKFISILGVSSSGKTVYVKQLLKRFCASLNSGILSYVNGSLAGIPQIPEDDQKPLGIEIPLPESTKTLNFKIPYFFPLSFRKDGILKKYDFVIYDVAGENLIFEKNRENESKFFTGYINKSDAIIVLIDPMQLVDDPEPKYSAGEMIGTLQSIFDSEVTVPTAITLSKSDLLLSSDFIKRKLNPDQRYFNESSPHNQNIQWDEKKKYFYLDEYQKLRGRLNIFFNDIAKQFDMNVNNTFKNASYFAVSSLLEGVDQKFTFELMPAKTWSSKDIDSMIELFPILSQELERLKKDLIEQENHPNEDIIDQSDIMVKKSFVFDQSSEDCKGMDRILGDISVLNTKAAIREKVRENFVDGHEIELTTERGNTINMKVETFADYVYLLKRESDLYKLDMYIQGYPRRDGKLESLRIEEPLFWLFAQMGIIEKGNRSLPQVPQPKTLGGKLKSLLTFWREEE